MSKGHIAPITRPSRWAQKAQMGRDSKTQTQTQTHTHTRLSQPNNLDHPRFNTVHQIKKSITTPQQIYNKEKQEKEL